GERALQGTSTAREPRRRTRRQSSAHPPPRRLGLRSEFWPQSFLRPSELHDAWSATTLLKTHGGREPSTYPNFRAALHARLSLQRGDAERADRHDPARRRSIGRG